jgi:hypothetical protein
LRGIDFGGFVAATVLLVFGAWFIASLGVFISSRARNGTRALFATFLVMFATGWIWPDLLWQALLWGHDPARPQSVLGAGRTFGGEANLEALLGFGVITALYVIAAAALTYGSIRTVRVRWCVN